MVKNHVYVSLKCFRLLIDSLHQGGFVGFHDIERPIKVIVAGGWRKLLIKLREVCMLETLIHIIPLVWVVDLNFIHICDYQEFR